MNFIRHYLLALQFFTRIPVTGKLAQWVGYSPALLRASAAHFPGVGALVGLVAALSLWGLSQVLPQHGSAALVAAVLSTACTVWLTGAFHEDGLADVADGLGGSANRARALDIMKDSRLGTYGVLALVLALLTKVSLLEMLLAHDMTLACVGVWLAHVVSRTWPLGLIRVLPHVGDTSTSKSKPLADQISWGSLGVAGVWLLLALLVVVWFTQALAQQLIVWLWALAASMLAALWMWRLFARRLQGFTGDCLGATQQTCELAFYLGLVLAL